MTFPEILAELNVPFEIEGRNTRPGWVQFTCPFCKGDLYAGFNTFGRYVNCWRCGGLRLTDTVMSLSGLSFPEVRKLLEDLPRESENRIELRGKLVMPKASKLLKPHRTYLRGRGYDPKDLVRWWGLQGIGIATQLAWRILIPITLDGETVSWTTRSLRDSGSRYISAGPKEEIINNHHLLYGEDYCSGSIIVHEGPADVWRTGPGAVATLGTAITLEQIERLLKYSLRIICFDNEPQAQRRARKLCANLEMFPGETLNIVPTGKDTAVASAKDIKRLRSFIK